MMKKVHVRVAALLFSAAAILSSHESTALAQPPDAKPPIAVRWWGGGTISIESFWLPPVVLGPARDVTSADAIASFGLIIPVTPMVESETHVHPNPRPFALLLFDPSGAPQPIRQRYDRLPNQPRAMLQSADNRMATSGYELVVRSASGVPQREGGDSHAAFPLLVTVGGVRIVHWGDLGSSSRDGEIPSYVSGCDVLLLPLSWDGERIEHRDLIGLIQRVGPKFVVPLVESTDESEVDPRTEFAASAASEFEAVRARGNTFAVAASETRNAAPKFVILQSSPWEPSGELAELLDRMETACTASQKAFAPLSIEQMNFRPSNGTHTPRWNAEHMMGRQLGFFTEIYAALDPAFQPIDLNPAQMPDDYKAAHPDWTGAEEARHMQRANSLVRRFAYLLDGVPLDERAPGSRWTLRRLLVQMERHFAEHTTNVKQKFELPDWPAD